MGENNCTITLIDVGANKVKVISVLREIFGFGLKEANDIVNSIPYTFQEKYSSNFAKQIESQLDQVGAAVKLEVAEVIPPTPSQYDILTNSPKETTTYDIRQPYIPNYVQENVNVVDNNIGYTPRQELITYFKDVFQLESQIYTYERIEQEYAKKIASMGVPQQLLLGYKGKVPTISGERLEEIAKPEWIETKEYKELDSTKPKVHRMGNFIALSLWTLLLVLVIIGAIARAGVFALFWIALPIIGVGWFGYYMISEKLPISYHEFDAKKRAIYSYHCKCMQKEALIIAEHEKALIPHVKNECVELVLQPKENAKILLNKLYSKNIIFPKYRNFAAIAQIYEYLLSGRCSQLEGPNGAYNLYESELRQNIIIDRLDEIIWQLDRLNRTMSAICGAIQETNFLLGDISRTLGRIEANTALTAYNTQCIANNTNIANRYYY